MKRLTILLTALALVSLIFASCKKEEDKGTLNLSITDAPIDSENVTGVFITITDIQYHLSGNNFQSFSDFEGPQVFNLLDLTRGASELLGNLEMESGTYTQLRFILEAAEFGNGAPEGNPGCYIEFEGGETEPLFIPSGSQSGFKGVGAFTVPVSGTVDVTADFDVRKSVVEAGSSGRYILKPTIRLVVNNQAGRIMGGVTEIPEGAQVIIFAYEDGEYSESEAADPEPETPRFPKAISSDLVDESNNYHIDFLAPKTYELVVVSLVNGDFNQVLGIVEGVVVESNKTTTQSINVNDL